MAPKALDPASYDQGVELHRVGKSIKEAAAESGMSPTALGQELRRRGIETAKTPLWRTLPAHEIVSSYRSGLSELEVSKRFQVERATIRRVLVAHDVEIRSRSAAGLTRAARMTAEERKAQVAAAHKALKSRDVTR